VQEGEDVGPAFARRKGKTYPSIPSRAAAKAVAERARSAPGAFIFLCSNERVTGVSVDREFRRTGWVKE
jgi:hypothetical protein